MSLRHWAAALIVATIFSSSGSAAKDKDWVALSNAHAAVVLEALSKYSPEGAGSLGIDGFDEAVTDLGPNIYERGMADSATLLAELKLRLEKEAHPIVRQDIQILIKAVEDSMRSSELNRANMLPYYNISQQVFGGVRALIDPQVSRDRYPAAVIRVKRYAGLEEGYEPITEQAKARTIERFDVKGLSGPYRGEVEQDLQRGETFIAGIEQLLAGTDLQEWQEPYATLAGQLRDYNDWVREEILPRAREDFRLPPVMYEDALRNWGVDASPEQLIQTATQGYMDIRNEMEVIGGLVAKEKGYGSSDYRDVIGKLKEEGAIDGDKLLDHYQQVLGKIEKFLEAERIISLPDRPAGIRIGTAAETAAQPAPHLDPPRMIGNTGEYPYFVIPLIVQNDDGSWPQTDDTYEAGAWTLTAHEARPGHEMQFSSMIEAGVSVARAIFAFNSTNVEGWGLYAEAIAKPYMPLEGQLISLQYRLMRAARMFLDPMLNLGLISPEDAKRLIMEDIVIGETWAQNEIERYTYRMPGQATAYFYGYTKMQALRTQTELALRDDFDQQAFHDFVLAQGMLPPELLKKAVMEDFVPSMRN
ncbi:MAG: DUF885 domain-containing protein [Gammaproteobacteria bacterium]|nr:DUF885 domain-containing protein [Gammaproteobacteria bacterium]MDH4313897.1 DUF885 domain-containing protein [Gammaproteobacteria bacterium]MDH5213828.1 DUF885 domain-containing protein [Gammaproteobacteria bacterium]MDH5500918.1 DUF885 domain-containing protein [Gammaproteobacteria bacterium]